MSYELVQDAKSGKPYAMVDLLTKITEDITNIVWHYLGTRYSHRIDAEDVVQEVLFQVARDLPSCEATDWKQFMCWVFFISRNNTYKSVSLIKLGKSSADRTQAIGESWEASGHTQAPDQIAMHKEQVQEIMDLAQSISPRAREVCELLGQGNTPKEIAQILGIDVWEIYSTRRTLKDLANQSGVFETRKSDAWKPVASTSEQTEVASSPTPSEHSQIDANTKAMFRQWKRFAAELAAKTCPKEYQKGVAYLERALAKLPAEQQEAMAKHIGFEALQQRCLENAVS
jgi:RNA polymerase sigma factor (sigma-70 family)